MWVTMYFEDRSPIKWSIEEQISGAQPRSPQERGEPKEKVPSERTNPRKSPDAGIIESRIHGDFEGWEGETVFILDNGQVWQQASYAYTYHYAFRPKVLIFRTTGGHRLTVEGVDGSIYVRRIK